MPKVKTQPILNSPLIYIKIKFLLLSYLKRKTKKKIMILTCMKLIFINIMCSIKSFKVEICKIILKTMLKKYHQQII